MPTSAAWSRATRTTTMAYERLFSTSTFNSGTSRRSCLRTKNVKRMAPATIRAIGMAVLVAEVIVAKPYSSPKRPSEHKATDGLSNEVGSNSP